MTPLVAAVALAVSGWFGAIPAAANSFTRDAGSCDLNQRTRLTDLCPNGFGMPAGASTQGMLVRHANVAGMIVDSANRYGVDPRLALAVSAHEGRMSACAGSFTGVQGPMQLTQATGRGYGMDRGVLADNINGGMLTLRDAIVSCGGDRNIRCLADRYNGSTEDQRRSWTSGVSERLASLNQAGQAAPTGCDGQAQCIMGPGDFPAGRLPVAATPPAPAPTDVLVDVGQV
jgi:soluble lytic murein transglycosylase-like protein